MEDRVDAVIVIDEIDYAYQHEALLGTIYDIVDVLDANDMTNTLYRQFTERERFYKKRKYPYKILKFNL